MDYRPFGSTGVQVSQLCFGTMSFGGDADEAESGRLYAACRNRGINFFDTADAYSMGRSEEILGRLIAGERDNLIISSKCFNPMSDDINGGGANRRHIATAVEASLKRLGTDRLDILFMHQWDARVPLEETLRALEKLVRDGKVLYLGASNYAAYRLADSQWISKTEHLHRFVSLQMQYSLLVRDLEREHVPLCRQFGLGVLPWSPLAGGFLSGKYAKGAPPPAGVRLEKWKERLSDYDTERNWRTLEAVQAIAKARETTASAVSLAWLIAKPTVSSVIFGARSIEQLDANLAAADVKLTADEVQKLDEASAYSLGYPYEFMANIQKRW